MNIPPRLSNTSTDYLAHTPSADTQRLAPQAPMLRQAPPTLSDAQNSASTTTARGAENADMDTALNSIMDALSSLLGNIKQLVAQLSPKKTEPNTPAPIPANPRYEPHTAKPYSQTALVDGFRQQRGTMNCVTVAGIKAAMQRFGGPNEIYSSVQKTPDGYDISMRDNPNRIFHVTNEEIDEATQKSGFTGNNEKMLKEANFMYAVSAKRAQFENNDGRASESFSAALATLDSWEHTHEGLYRLGLKNYVEQTSAIDLANGAPGVMASDNHVYTVLNGRKDDYGTLGYRPAPWDSALKLR
ncbi:hypothetical protein GIW50_06165 [Pseudomonas syringae]|uniref:Uncharacterized protein n=1 Tax=Pseudomonas syringae TaxID=317 RepID=A0A9Q3X728_PSESX|nr:hypothetical protein [Pseudomonas syringae]MCF5063812.1 hypothetical protein [Pseudomonas syringae]MCF5117995.1 hypothetical protein [Pseudomonas syringae]MCF5381628.1 hypothetical protein [Pseudomonas syringae]